MQQQQQQISNQQHPHLHHNYEPAPENSPKWHEIISLPQKKTSLRKSKFSSKAIDRRPITCLSANDQLLRTKPISINPKFYQKEAQGDPFEITERETTFFKRKLFQEEVSITTPLCSHQGTDKGQLQYRRMDNARCLETSSSNSIEEQKIVNNKQGKAFFTFANTFINSGSYIQENSK